MCSAERGSRKPVTVIHFVKPGAARPRSGAKTMPELRARDEDTDPAPPPPSSYAARRGAKATKAKPRRTSSGKQPAAKPPPKTPLERVLIGEKTIEVTMPDAVAAALGGRVSKAPTSRERSATPVQVADLALFGHQMFERGQVLEARKIFEGLVKADPGDGFAHTMLGTIFLALNQQHRALTQFQTALAIDANDLAALVYRGEIRLNRGRVRAALEDLIRANSLGPADDPFVERARRLVRMVKKGRQT